MSINRIMLSVLTFENLKQKTNTPFLLLTQNTDTKHLTLPIARWACSNLFTDRVESKHETKHCGNPKGGVETAPRGTAALAGTLLDSLDENVDRDAESAWEAEIVMRLKEIDEGKVNLIPWAEARVRIAGQ